MRFLEHRPLAHATTTQAALAERTVVLGAPVASERTELLGRVEDTASIPPVGTAPPGGQRRRRRWPWILAAIILLIGAAGALLYARLAAEHRPVPHPVALVSVPNVVGSQEQGAVQVLSNLGLQSSLAFQASSTASGTVIAEHPAAGTRMKKGATVNLTVSSGPASVTVPKVVGESASSAEAKLLALGFNVSTNYQAASAPQGTVIAESPSGGSQAPHGSTVVLTVSNGPSKIAVPNVVGLSLATASNKLGADQLAVGNVTYQSSSTVPSGDVISTNPAAGTEVAPGSSVDLVVSQGNQVTVPNVVGDSLQTAEQTLQNAGLQIGTVTPSNSPPTAVVASTNPPAGQSVPAGTVVDITMTSPTGGSSGGPTPSAG